MYKIINQLTNQEETFEHRDDLFSKLEIINERMKSNRITGTYRLYSLNSEGEILQEESLEIPFIGIIDQLLENFGTSVGEKKRGFLHFLAKHKENTSLPAERESQSQPEPELGELTLKKEADRNRQRIAELVAKKPQNDIGEEKPLGEKDTFSSDEWTTEHFSRLDETEAVKEERVDPTQDMPTQEVVSSVEKSSQEENRSLIVLRLRPSLISSLLNIKFSLTKSSSRKQTRKLLSVKIKSMSCDNRFLPKRNKLVN